MIIPVGRDYYYIGIDITEIIINNDYDGNDKW